MDTKTGSAKLKKNDVSIYIWVNIYLDFSPTVIYLYIFRYMCVQKCIYVNLKLTYEYLYIYNVYIYRVRRLLLNYLELPLRLIYLCICLYAYVYKYMSILMYLHI
jgi:hypothetical protein